MHQESVDKLKGTMRSDTLLFILLIVFFFFAGSIATFLKAKFCSNIPLYVFAAVLGALIILVYKLRIVGYRYTVFYKEPEPEYDPRFDDYTTHEDYPYPVGTILIERTSSAKGEIVEIISKNEIVKFLEPGEEYAADEELRYSPAKKEKSRSLILNRNGKTVRMYFTPSDEFKKYVESMLEA
ncbi:MAG: hypothetical protein K6F68_09220 [Clostridiales bacterium]|nr:hypothetical protein [Clostridiales bacterium]